jgi:hypothetical protein
MHHGGNRGNNYGELNMTAKIYHIRPASVFLDRVLNPARDERIGAATPAQINEACGVIPDFFLAACIDLSGDFTLRDLCDGMNALYGFGGFQFAWTGNVTDQGVYEPEHPGDGPFYPLARFGFEDRLYCYVYNYGVTAVVDRQTGEFKVARFD